MVFPLVFNSTTTAEDVREKFQKYLNERKKDLSLCPEGILNSGVITFENLHVRLVSFVSIDEIPQFIVSLLAPGISVCLYFDKATCSIMFVVVQDKEVSLLTEILESDFFTLTA